MSKTTTTKITTRIITTHLLFLDTIITIKSYLLFFGETSAKAPCTRTTVGRDSSCGFVFIALPPGVFLFRPSWR